MPPPLDSAKQDSQPQEDRKTPPAFLDLADSASRNGAGLEHILAQKRFEHERMRLLQRHQFEEQMRKLEQEHAKEERELLGVPLGMHHIAVSAPTTPPRVPSVVHSEHGQHSSGRTLDSAVAQERFNAQLLASAQIASQTTILPQALQAMVDKEAKRKSVTYAPTANDLARSTNASPVFQGTQGYAGAKSMPASRRGSPGARDPDELVHGLSGLSIHEREGPVSAGITPKPILRQTKSNGRYSGAEFPSYNAALLDDELNQDINAAMKFLPADSEEGLKPDAFKLSASSAALDLAPLSQTPPRTSFMNRAYQADQKSSEWPPFSGNPRPAVRQSSFAATPELGTKLAGSATSTPLNQTHSPVGSRRGSPRGFAVGEGVLGSNAFNSRSVPVSPIAPGGGAPGLLKQGTPQVNSALPASTTPEGTLGPFGSQLSAAGDLGRIAASPYDSPAQYNLQQGADDQVHQYGMDLGYASGGVDHRFGSGFNSPYDGSSRTSGYSQHSRYGLGVGGHANSGRVSGSMNGSIHGPKHKRGDMDREYNRFAGSRLEDLIPEIPGMCKDQHGCRFLQKKLEEGIPEHRDIIFRETFSHFADLMTDPFGNYLCQKLLEYSTDDQRNLICESVASDLVTISLNMHGTRAVQKMIDFLSTQRQADPRYNDQIVAIIRALSPHVVTLIKDLNGNHVIQKCLNRLVPADNQFIYNAVAVHCVEVATHRHGCCVLQRCIDHASEQQRIQLVTEITYHALTLVQDPYGNYVVQYILDLNDNRFSDAVIRQFMGNVCALSVQKFSSNVIEKCIRVAEHNTRKALIEELLNRSRLEKLLRDSFGNYCVQTALDYSEPSQRALLVEGIRPILPLIRNTPYGKRIQSKLQREQMEHNSSHYQNTHQHQAFLNMALNNQLGAGRGQLASPLVNDYNRSPLYGLSPGMHGSPVVTHSPALHAQYSTPSPAGLNDYVLQNTVPAGLGLGSYQGLGQYSNGLQNVYTGAGGAGAGGADIYQQQGRSAFQY